MQIPKKKKVKIFIIGVGGTGSHLSRLLYRLLYDSPILRENKEIQMWLCDGDRFEEKNKERQDMPSSAIDKNKAEVLAKGYSSQKGIEALYIPKYIESSEILINELKQTSPLYQYSKPEKFIPILISCVDNNASRKMFHEVFNNVDEIIYIDSGNGEFVGQVVVGYKYKGKVILPPAAHYFPEMLDEPTSNRDKLPTEQSCSDRFKSAPQTMMANVWAATIISSYINDIILMGKLDTCKTEFSSLTTKTAVTWISDILKAQEQEPDEEISDNSEED